MPGPVSSLYRLVPALLVLSLPALAQDGGTAAVPAPSRAPAPPLVNTPDTEALRGVAKAFFQALLALDSRGATHLTSSPFYLEGARLEGEEAISQALIRQLRSKRTDLLTLYSIDVYSLEEMEQKFGKLPGRLSGMPVQERGAMFAVGNISGRATVAMLKVVGGNWRVVGFHD